MTNSALSSTAPTEENRTVTTSLFEGEVARAAPTRRRNVELRTREHLTPGEVETPDRGRQGQPLRPSGCDHDSGRLPARAPGGRGLRPALGPGRLQWRGAAPTHPLLGDELRALRRLQRESPPSPFVFVSERGTPFTTAGFARMIERAARKWLGLELKAHPHMLRHACGYALANKGHDTRRFRVGASYGSGSEQVQELLAGVIRLA